MKKFASFAAILMCAAMTFSFIGCDNPVAEETGYKVTYSDGVADAEIAVPVDSNEYYTDDTVKIIFKGIGENSGYSFAGWSDGKTIYTQKGKNSFKMGSENVTLTAQWTENGPELYSITIAENISNGSVSADRTSAIAGELITLTASPAKDYKFDSWIVKDEDGAGITVTDNSFTMPAKNVTVSASFTNSYEIKLGSCQNGSISADKTSAKPGDKVTLNCSPRDEYKLSSYTVTGADGTNISVSTNSYGAGSFTMPAQNVTVTATFIIKTYNISVSYGIAKDAAGNRITSASKGTVVTIVANAPSAGQDFTNWSTSWDFDYADKNAATTTFIMPGKSVSIYAIYQNYYTVTYEDNVDNEVITMPVDTKHYYNGDTVTVKFDGAGTRNGYTLGGWSIGSDFYTSDGTRTITVKNSNITLSAQWNYNAEAATATKAVGDIILADGSFIRFADKNKMSDLQKSKAVAVIFDAATNKGVGFTLGEKKKWCSEGAGLYNTNEYNTSLTDGIANKNNCHPHMVAWSEGSYPAFWFAETYSAGIFKSGWYLGAQKEMADLLKNIDTVNECFDAVGKTVKIEHTIKINPETGEETHSYEWLWTSSAWTGKDTNPNYAALVWDTEGGPSVNKTSEHTVCAIRVFN